MRLKPTSSSSSSNTMRVAFNLTGVKRHYFQGFHTLFCLRLWICVGPEVTYFHLKSLFKKVKKKSTEETSLSINSNKYLYRSFTILENFPNVRKLGGWWRGTRTWFCSTVPFGALKKKKTLWLVVSVLLHLDSSSWSPADVFGSADPEPSDPNPPGRRMRNRSPSAPQDLRRTVRWWKRLQSVFSEMLSCLLEDWCWTA